VLSQSCEKRLLTRKNSSPTTRIFIKFFISVIFLNMSKKFNFQLKNLKRIMGILREDRYIFIIISLSLSLCLSQFFLEWKIFQAKVVEKNQTTHFVSWIKIDQLDVTRFFISLFHAQHVSDVSTSIVRSLWLICWVISCVVLLWYDVCWCYVVVRLGWCGIRMQAEALLQPALHL
jgi:hypothetical protein